MISHRVRLVAAALVLLLAGGCKVDISVGVDAARDGTGEVRVSALLDQDAAKRMGDLRSQLKVDDLIDAGWKLEGPDPRDDGSVEVALRHDFDDPAQAGRLLAQLTGAGGPFRDFAVRQHRTFLRTTTEFRGAVDLSAGAEAFSDPELTTTLGGQPLGVPVDQLERQLGESLNRLLGFQVAVRLPGSVESNAPTQAGNGAVWSPKLGEQVTLTATSQAWNVVNLALGAICVVATSALVVLLLARIVAARGRRPVEFPGDADV